MDEVLSSPAHLPDAFIRLSPNLCEIFQYDRPQGAATICQTYSHLAGLKQGIGDFAENV